MIKTILFFALSASAIAVPASTAYTAAPSSVYAVQPGDTVWNIAQQYHTEMDEIIQQNRLVHPSLIFPGQKLYITQVDRRVKGAENKVLELTNQARITNGLKPLSLSWELTRMARHKSEDMRDHSYVAHLSPTYGSPFDMMRAYQIPFRAAEENIAAGYSTAEEAMNCWLNSPEYRRNILNPSLTEIGCGVAVDANGRVYWTQEFVVR